MCELGVKIMAIFKKTAEEQKKIDSFKQKLQNTINTLEPYSEQADITELKRSAKDFDEKIQDFYKDDRKLNIGVIGQVKAGKSTFLNTLLWCYRSGKGGKVYFSQYSAF